MLREVGLLYTLESRKRLSGMYGIALDARIRFHGISAISLGFSHSPPHLFAARHIE